MWHAAHCAILQYVTLRCPAALKQRPKYLRVLNLLCSYASVLCGHCCALHEQASLGLAEAARLQVLGTDDFIASAVSAAIDPRAISTLVFILGALISLATGTSWGTMAILVRTHLHSQSLLQRAHLPHNNFKL